MASSQPFCSSLLSRNMAAIAGTDAPIAITTLIIAANCNVMVFPTDAAAAGPIILATIGLLCIISPIVLNKVPMLVP